jgi:hypothetical protein
MSADAEPAGYDATSTGYAGTTPPTATGTPTPGPSSYRDSGWYSNALSEAEANQANQYQVPNGQATASGIIGMLLALIGGGKSGGGGGRGAGGSGTGGGALGNLSKLLGGGGKGDAGPQGPPAPAGTGGNWSQDPAMSGGNQIVIGPDGQPYAMSPYGQMFPMGPGTDYQDNPQFYQTDPSLPLLPINPGSSPFGQSDNQLFGGGGDTGGGGGGGDSGGGGGVDF